ncbi:MAG TPA: nucleoside phosphorylase [Pedobacter sp.]|uniref:nucleoside phosphorylase n=1 Tax=Pedobacter sp. TaxID=1411316 RepID=UPI002D00997A|nr:nucleoside phosphorylase [Pedobacter sp.]HMI05334.1 nucleoside phosphorylase [Pedobacter sp.]
MGQALSPADLIINPDGSIYHLNLLPEDISDTIITVGDPDRVFEVSKHLDHIELKKGKREFITHTGYLGKKRITVISTGIGTDNIDIVFNELDALVNIDLSTRTIKQELTSLNIIRIGTSGTIQSDIPMGTILASTFGIGLDSLMQYYLHELSGDEAQILTSFKSHISHIKGINPYVTAADSTLLKQIGSEMQQGITVTAPGFYAPQGRQVRAKNTIPDLITLLNSFRYGNSASSQQRITNLEMETAGIYALAKTLGHKALSVNAILANRVNQSFSPDPAATVEKAIKMVFDKF